MGALYRRFLEFPTVTCTAVVVAFLSGCGEPVAKTPDSATAAQTSAEVDTLYAQVFGNAAQRSAGEFEVNYVLNHPVEVCMQKAGFDYDWQYQEDAWAGYNIHGAGLLGSEWLAPFGGHPVSDSAQDLAPVQRENAERELGAIPAGNPSRQPGYWDARATCAAAEGNPNGVEYPDGAMDLLISYNAMLSSAERDLDSQSETYAGCMQGAGWDVVDQEIEGSGFLAVWELVDSMRPELDQIPAPDEPSNAAWEKFLDNETAALAADEACRGDIRERGLVELAPVLARFEVDHAKEIASVQAGWQQLVAQATAHGLQPPN